MTDCGAPRTTLAGDATGSGVTAFDGGDGALLPAVLVAVTVKLTGWPSVSSGTIAHVLGSSAVMV